MFARLPVGPAIRWLEAMASDDPRDLLDFADRRWKESGRRDAIAADLGWRADSVDASLVHEGHPVASLGLVEVRGREEDRHALARSTFRRFAKHGCIASRNQSSRHFPGRG